VGAERVRDLHGGVPTPPVAPEISTRSPALEVTLGHERVVGGREGLGKARRPDPN
jgi:hypothetical protein